MSVLEINVGRLQNLAGCSVAKTPARILRVYVNYEINIAKATIARGIFSALSC